jgi:hypothetical protein
MTGRQYLKLIIIIVLSLLSQQVLFAQDMPQNNAKTAENINAVENNPQTGNPDDANSDNPEPPNPDNSSGTFEIFNIGNIKPDKPDIKPKIIIKNNQNKNILNLKKSDKKPGNNETNSIRTKINRLLKKYHLNPTIFVAILGLFGTFLGLFSTWTIYLLNKKNNDPLLIDKKDSAIRYFEAIDKIKEIINADKLNHLDILLDSALNKSLSPSKLNELINLISFYSKSTIAISEIPLIDIHNRYKKHIKQNRTDTFNSFIALYKMIEVDGKFYSTTDGIFDYDNLQSMNFFAEDNVKSWKQKITTLLSLEEKANIIKKYIIKDLKK